MGKKFEGLLILAVFFLGLLGVFIGLRESDEVRVGKKCDTQREVFKKKKKVWRCFK